MERPDLDALELAHGEGQLTPSCSPMVRELIAYARHLEERVQFLEQANENIIGQYQYGEARIAELETARDFHSEQRRIDKDGYESLIKVLRERNSELETALEPFATFYYDESEPINADMVRNAARVLRKGAQSQVTLEELEQYERDGF